MDQWKQSFLQKLNKAQTQYQQRFEAALEGPVQTALNEIGPFLCDNGFRTSTPLREPGRRSIKFELSENAYTLLLFRFSGVGEYELRTESFAPGQDPQLARSVGRVCDIDRKWALQRFQKSLDQFVDLLNASTSSEASAGAKKSAAPPDQELVVA